MKTSVERLEGNTVKLTVTLEPAEVDEAIDKAYKEIGGKMKVPGFRPGKAPRAVIDTHVGRDYVLSSATEWLVNESYPKALDAEELRPIEAPEMDAIDTVEAGTEFAFEAEIEVRPELTLSSTDGLIIELPPEEATDAEISVQLQHFREGYATLEPVEDRGIQADDYAVISFVGTIEGEPYEGNTVERYLYEMGHGLMPVQFDEALLGAKPDSEVRVEFPIPETSSNPEYVGKNAEFDVTVHEIKRKVLPELDDEFAGNVGGFDTLDELKDNVRKQITEQKALAYQRLKERAMREAIAARLEGDVPEPMVRSMKDRMMRDFMNGLRERNMEFGDYLAATGLEPEKVEEDITTQAEEAVREDLALEALFRTEGMEVTDEDLENALGDMAKASGESTDEMRKRWEEMGLTQVVREEVMHTKALVWISEHVEVVPMTVSEDETVSQAAGTSSESEGADDEPDLPVAAAEFDVDEAATADESVDAPDEDDAEKTPTETE